MNPAHPHDFDTRARQAHAAALAQVSPQTLARLRAARHSSPASQRRAWPWLTATAFSAVLAVMIGLQWLPSSPAPGAGIRGAGDHGGHAGDGASRQHPARRKSRSVPVAGLLRGAATGDGVNR